MKLSTLASLGLLTLAACDPGEDDTESKARSEIVNGKPSDASDDEVVLLLTHIPSKDTAQGQYYENCTGTLLAPNLVLTARHCVSLTTEGQFSCGEDGKLVAGPGGTVGADFVPSNAHVYVGPKLPDTIDPTMFPGVPAAYVHDASTVTCNADVALIVLATPIENAKIAPIRLDGDVQKGEQIVAIGWGATTTSFIPDGRQRRDGVTVVDVGPSPTMYLGGELAEKEFLASESVCFGDSGGPALDAATGAVVGVVSRGPNGGITQNGSGCVGTQHTFMKTSGFKDLIMSAFTMAGASPWIEGQPQPEQGGAGGTGAGGTGGGGGAPATQKKPSTKESSGCAIGGGGDGDDLSGVAFGCVILGGARWVRRRQRRSPVG